MQIEELICFDVFGVCIFSLLYAFLLYSLFCVPFSCVVFLFDKEFVSFAMYSCLEHNQRSLKLQINNKKFSEI